jgi:glutaredoxin-like protein NrdH
MHKVTLYALSTCIWCRRARQFLDSNGVVYDCVYVDKLEGQEKKDIMAVVRGWNPRESFPTLIVDDATVIVGLDEARMREVLGL